MSNQGGYYVKFSSIHEDLLTLIIIPSQGTSVAARLLVNDYIVVSSVLIEIRISHLVHAAPVGVTIVIVLHSATVGGYRML